MMMWKLTLILGSILVPFTFATPLEVNNTGTNSTKNNKTLSEDEEPSAAFKTALERYVLSIPIESFEGDVVLLQFPDASSRTTSYRHLDTLHAVSHSVYVSKEDDSRKEVVVLTAYEDRIPVSKDLGKRVWVVLRRALHLGPRVYYVTYLYVTDALDNTPGMHSFGGRKVFVEWDFWDNRHTVDVRAKSLEYVCSCGTSIFVPCSSNETLDYPVPFQGPHVKDSDLSYPAIKRKYSETELYRGNEGYDPNEFMDIYGDLDIEVMVPKETLEAISDLAPPSNYLNPEDSGKTVDIQSVAEDVANGLVGMSKSYGGLYGGLGTPEALLHTVGIEVGIEGTDDLYTGDEPHLDQLLLELKQANAGGLGGWVTKLEDQEKPPTPGNLQIDIGLDQINPLLATETTNASSSTPSSASSVEKPYVHFGWIETTGAEGASDPFVGFGGCRYHKVTPEMVKALPTVEDLVRTYQTVFKTQCLPYDYAHLMKVVSKSGLLEVEPDEFTFKIKEDAPHFNNEKLTLQQIRELLRGIQLSMFSKAWMYELLQNSSNPTASAPDGSPVSRSVFTYGQAILQGVSFSQDHLWMDTHGFKLVRNMIRTLKIIYRKLSEDREMIRARHGSKGETELNFNNRVYVLGLVQYLMRNTATIYSLGTDPYRSFQDFYLKNKAVFEDRITTHEK